MIYIYIYIYSRSFRLNSPPCDGHLATCSKFMASCFLGRPRGTKAGALILSSECPKPHSYSRWVRESDANKAQKVFYSEPKTHLIEAWRPKVFRLFLLVGSHGKDATHWVRLVHVLCWGLEYVRSPVALWTVDRSSCAFWPVKPYNL